MRYTKICSCPLQSKIFQTLYDELEPQLSCWVLAYPGGIIDLHLCQQFSINAEVTQAAFLIVDNAVTLAGHWDEPRALMAVWALQSPQQVPRDGVDQTWTLCRTKTHMRTKQTAHWEKYIILLFQHRLFNLCSANEQEISCPTIFPP